MEKNRHTDTAHPARKRGKARRVIAHVAALIVIYLAFSFALFLGLQVSPLYGTIGIAFVFVLGFVYVWAAFIRR